MAEGCIQGLVWKRLGWTVRRWDGIVELDFQQIGVRNVISVGQVAEELLVLEEDTAPCCRLLCQDCVHFVARIVVCGREHMELVVRQVILCVCGLKS